MNTLIIYHSKTGFTKKYAQWLHEDLGCDFIPYSQRRQADLSKYQTIVFGSGSYVGKICKLPWFKKQLPKLRDKKLCVFFTGAMPAEPADIRRIERENFTQDEQRRIKSFYLRGGLNYAAMNPKDKLLMAVFRKTLKSNASSPKERIMLQNVEQSFDLTSRDDLKPLKDYLQSEKPAHQ